MVGEPRKLLRQPRVSPDGRRIAFLADDQNTDVWVSNADGSGATRITFTPGNKGEPAWIPHQNALAFFCPKSGGGAICSTNADGSGDIKELADQADWPTFSPDGSVLLYSTSGSALRGLLTLDPRAPGAKAQEFFMSAETMYPIAILAGNRFAVFWGYSAGRPGTFLKPFPTGDGKWEVTGLSVDFPRLLPGGKAIGALESRPDGHASLVSVPFETSPAVTFGPRKELFSGLPESLQFDAEFDLNADGTRLLAVMPKSTGPVQRGIVVVLNWIAEFQKH